MRLADLLAARGDLDELRARADAGDQFAASRLADLLAERGDLDELRARAEAGDWSPPCGWLTYWPNAEPATYRPDQLALPGMPPRRSAVTAARGRADDPELAAVAAELRALDGDGSRMAAAIRGALDMLLDGQHTGRYRWDQLHKTEKTHAGTLVEIALARSLRLADGTALDYTIAGADVDCKFSHRLGGWMIPPEADGKLMLLVQASDEDGTWSAGLLRATGENLSPAGNRDGKRALNDRGRAAVRWLHARAPLQENALIRLPERDVAAIFALRFGSAAGERAVPAGAADAGQPDRGGHGRHAGRLHEAGPRRRRGARPAARRGHRDLRGLRRGPGARLGPRPAPPGPRRVRQRPARSAAAAAPATTPVPSGSRAPTGCSPCPPTRPRPRPPCPGENGEPGRLQVFPTE